MVAVLESIEGAAVARAVREDDAARRAAGKVQGEGLMAEIEGNLDHCRADVGRWLGALASGFERDADGSAP